MSWSSAHELFVPSVMWTLAVVMLFIGALRSASRFFPRQSRRSWVQHLELALLLVTVVMVWSVAILGGLAWLRGSTILLLATGFLLVSCCGSMAGHTQRWTLCDGRFRGLWWPIVLSCGVVWVDVVTTLPIPPTSWDAMTYHLYFPARWLQDGRIFHIPTVFSDNAAAFAPQNGALFFAWQMALSNRDALCNVANLLCLVVMVLGLYAICREVGVDRTPAVLAALSLCWLAPIRSSSWSATVDIFMVAFWVSSVAWLLRYSARLEVPALLASGLAAGLAIGAKTVALPLVGLASLPLLVDLVRGKARAGHLALWLVCVIAAGGWWFVANGWLYGNPLFPLELSFGGVTLAGAYGTAAVRAGEFHLGSAAAVGTAVVRQFGPAICLLMVCGGAALIASIGTRTRELRRTRAVVLSMVVAWTLLFSFWVPHNNQARFLLPSLVMSFAGIGLLFQWIHERLKDREGWTSLAWIGVVTIVALASPPWAEWRASIDVMTLAGVDVSEWIVIAFGSTVLSAIGTVSAGIVWRSFGPRLGIGKLLGALGLLGLAGGVAATSIAVPTAVAGLHADVARPAALARADFRGWAAGYMPFAVPRSGPLRIAYTGSNIPYALMGPGWPNRVVYVNTRGGASDGFYDFWSRDPRTYSYHKPGIYRQPEGESLIGQDDQAAARWLTRLQDEKVDQLVIFALHRAERRYIYSTPAGFPMEQEWVSRFPDQFEPIFIHPAAEVYRIVER